MQSYVQGGDWNCLADHCQQGTYIYCTEAKTWRSMDAACSHYHMAHMDNKVYQGIFSLNKRPPTELTKLIWHTLIAKLRPQYERIDGTDDVADFKAKGELIVFRDTNAHT